MKPQKPKMFKCRKCKATGESIVLIELWRDHTIEFQQYDDGAIEPEGILRDGSPYKVVARCSECNHYWTLRGILQITNLNSYDARRSK